MSLGYLSDCLSQGGSKEMARDPEQTKSRYLLSQTGLAYDDRRGVSLLRGLWE